MSSLEEAPPEAYTTEYYLQQCGGYDLFRASGGLALDEMRSFALGLVPAGARDVLDVGCGRGELVAALAARSYSSTGIDFSPDAITLAWRLARDHTDLAHRMEFKTMDARSLEFADASFDAVLMTDVVEHIAPPGLAKVLSECKRVLRPDGRLIIHTLPTLNYLRFGQHLKRLKQSLRGDPIAPIVTLESEAQYARHCNIQSHKSLASALSGFDRVSVWYLPTSTAGWGKRLSTWLGLDPFLCSHLWATADRTPCAFDRQARSSGRFPG